ncbi:flagellin [Pseudoflavonifractor sp. 524-17]|uniref:flagellin N-terminal helical domain-containing protein n=1 Tax=Pseudoflavonifractor sp. 524-17 TaxID=2304577 RepID=UPI00137A4330|nr:flagellin [Pseudoflavonifractor sp. 524-17]NCE66481.1 flagellin [Pseudoflavonifractor sp. 524-17]
MRIQHNIMAMSAYRNYTNNVSAMKKNLEKLSSGYKINRAGDDAAGLAISEKMRAQITGLETAQKNAKDGISLVQTAEGALTEVHDMLNRMVELATQSANGTYDNTTDRAQMQKEIQQLKDEINRIADSSNFNGIKLLNGEMSGKGTVEFTDQAVTAVADGLRGTGAGEKGELSIDVGDLDLRLAATGTTLAVGTTIAKITVAGKTVASISLGAALSAGETYVFSAADLVAATGDLSIGGLDFTASVDGGKVILKGKELPTQAAADTFNGTAKSGGLADLATDVTSNNGFDLAVHHDKIVSAAGQNDLAQGHFTLANIQDGTTIKIGDETYSFKVGADGVGGGGTVIDLSMYTSTYASLATEAAKLLSQQTNKLFDITAEGNSGKITLTEKKGAFKDYSEWDLKGPTSTAVDATWKNVKTGESIVQIGTPGAATGKSLQLQIGDTAEDFNQLKVDIQDMHCSSLGIDGLNIGTQEGATEAIDKIKAAINMVSDVRGTLGATQNRLDHTINNLSVMTENIQDAESTIRDTDVAEEMMSYTKNNILIQSAQAMLAQANQVPQGVLQLLQ